MRIFYWVASRFYLTMILYLNRVWVLKDGLTTVKGDEMRLPTSKIELAAATDESRYTIQAVKLDVEKKRLMATDGRHAGQRIRYSSGDHKSPNPFVVWLDIVTGKGLDFAAIMQKPQV